MKILLNGEEREVADEITLPQLLESLSLAKERIAIELNTVVVRKRDWDSTLVKEGDRVEVVHFVGGG